MTNQEIAIILPAFNESEHIEHVLTRLADCGHEIVVIDDGSADSTADLARQHNVHVLRHAVNLGKGSALRTGVEYAFEQLHMQAVVLIDADEQHDPAEIVHFVDQLKSGAPLVFGVRSLYQDMPWQRRMGNLMVSGVLWARYRTWIPDILCGYRAFDSGAYELIKWRARQYDVEVEMAANAAKNRQPISFLPVTTIYHNYVRGMNFLDALRLITRLPLW